MPLILDPSRESDVAIPPITSRARVCVTCSNCVDQYGAPIGPGGIPHCAVVVDLVLGTAAPCDTLRVVGVPTATRCGLDGELYRTRV